MKPVNFEQANIICGPPPGMEESQVMRVSAYRGEAEQGSVDGLELIVVAWRPDDEELERIKNGSPIFLTCMGGLLPHFLSTRFEEAINPA